MYEDIDFNPNTISIMSKLKEPKQYNNMEHSLSKIIREQAVDYLQEVYDEEIRTKTEKAIDHHKIKINKKIKNMQLPKENLPANFSIIEQERNDNRQCYPFRNINKIEKRSREPGITINGRANEFKTNVINFEQSDDLERVANYHSKKQKRGENIIFEQQKTKKIEFPDMDKYKIDTKLKKKQEPTKIKQHTIQNYPEQNINLEICSKENSENLMDQRDATILHHRTVSNYNYLILQVKEIMNIIRLQYVETEKIQVKKSLVKLQAQIRRMKIGFRGLSESLGKNGSNIYSTSKIKSQHDYESKKNTLKRKQEKTNKVESKLIQKLAPPQKLLFQNDYGLEQISSINNQGMKSKLMKIEEEYNIELANQSKYTSKLIELHNKYISLSRNNVKKTQTKPENKHSQSTSIIKKQKILRQKISFLKNQIKESKGFYSNKIKRLKNQNSIIRNEISYSNKEIEQIAIQNRVNKIKSDANRPNLLFFQQAGRRKRTEPIIAITKLSSSKENPPNFNHIKSLQSIDSIKSINSPSKPTLGSVNSAKSIKIQVSKIGSDPFLIKPKLKIHSPHHLSPPMEYLQQNSIHKKKKFEIMTKRDLPLSKQKSSSLDIAFKELQQKYSKHLKKQVHQSEYYRKFKE